MIAATERLGMKQIAEVSARGIVVTAPGDTVDFVSRFFAPPSGLPVDPVCGSAHTTLTPYWACRPGRNSPTAMKLSKRRGWLWCRRSGGRVSGHARAYLTGTIGI